jgi:hypothetical protein
VNLEELKDLEVDIYNKVPEYKDWWIKTALLKWGIRGWREEVAKILQEVLSENKRIGG